MAPRAASTVRPTTASLVEATKVGLFADELLELKAALDVSAEQMAALAGMSRATFNRRRPSTRLTPVESDRVIRFARLMALAVEVMGTPEHARQWLKRPQQGLANNIPLDYALTEVGAREVEDLLLRIEHGVYT